MSNVLDLGTNLQPVASALTLAVANLNPVHMRQVKDEAGAPLSSLMPHASLFDAAGQPVANAQQVLLAAVAGVPGDYRGSIQAMSAATNIFPDGEVDSGSHCLECCIVWEPGTAECDDCGDRTVEVVVRLSDKTGSTSDELTTEAV